MNLVAGRLLGSWPSGSGDGALKCPIHGGGVSPGTMAGGVHLFAALFGMIFLIQKR